MRRALMVPVWIGLLATLSAGCATAGERVDDLRTVASELGDSAGSLTDQARFCLSLTRMVAAIESGSPDTAREAAEEALARAPDDIVADTREVVEALRRTHDAGGMSARDPQVVAAVDALERTARQACTP